MSETLRPCICGRPARMQQGVDWFAVICSGVAGDVDMCPFGAVTTLPCPTAEEAIAAWNNRPAENALLEVVLMILKMIDDLFEPSAAACTAALAAIAKATGEEATHG